MSEIKFLKSIKKNNARLIASRSADQIFRMNNHSGVVSHIFINFPFIFPSFWRIKTQVLNFFLCIMKRKIHSEYHTKVVSQEYYIYLMNIILTHINGLYTSTCDCRWETCLLLCMLYVYLHCILLFRSSSFMVRLHIDPITIYTCRSYLRESMHINHHAAGYPLGSLDPQ